MPIEVKVDAADLLGCNNNIERSNVISRAMWQAGIQTQTVMGQETLGGTVVTFVRAIVPAGPFDLNWDDKGGLTIRATNPPNLP